MPTPNKGRAYIFYGPGQALEKREFEVPHPKENEILIRITCSTLCGSDIHSYVGNRGTPCPTVLGHEIVGRVAKLPSSSELKDLNGEEVKVGDRITWSVAASCGHCFYCNDGLPQKCVRLFKYGHESIETTYPFNGGLADYCLLAPGTAILKVPESLPDFIACPANCATATVAAAFRLAGDCRNRTVLIQGAGMLGLTATAMARSHGAREVIASDISEERLEKAKEFGATATVNPDDRSDALSATVQERTEGRGVDIAIEVCGVNASVENCIESLRIGGKCICVGTTFPNPPLPISIESLVRAIKQIQGIHNYIPQDLASAVEFLTEWGEHYPFASLVGKTFSLDETPAAFQYAIDNNVFRVAIVP